MSTGAESDLQRATTLARQTVTMCGMSTTVGLVHCAHPQQGFLPGMPGGALQRECSEQTAREIDEEVRMRLDGAYADAKTILIEHRRSLDAVAAERMRRETLNASEFRRLAGLPAKTPPTVGPTRSASPAVIPQNGAGRTPTPLDRP